MSCNDGRRLDIPSYRNQTQGLRETQEAHWAPPFAHSWPRCVRTRLDGSSYRAGAPAQVFAHPEEPEWARFGAAGVARDGKNEANGSNGDGWVYDRLWPGGQNGNPGLVAGLRCRRDRPKGVP